PLATVEINFHAPGRPQDPPAALPHGGWVPEAGPSVYLSAAEVVGLYPELGPLIGWTWWTIPSPAGTTLYGYRPTWEGILSLYVGDEDDAAVVRWPVPEDTWGYSHGSLSAQVAAILHGHA
ncbi:MAG: hypothetical protein ACRDQ5_00830, partial [Sciscionella sp.]